MPDEQRKETIAYKRISMWSNDEAQQRKVARELKIYESLHHPRIVSFYGSKVENGHTYIFMELMDESLEHRLKERGKISESLAKSYFRQILGALDYLHAKGIIHRDLKPGNILLNNNDEGEAKIADFGCTSLTHSLSLFGTPGYIAPEVGSQGAQQGELRLLRRRLEFRLPGLRVPDGSAVVPAEGEQRGGLSRATWTGRSSASGTRSSFRSRCTSRHRTS